MHRINITHILYSILALSFASISLASAASISAKTTFTNTRRFLFDVDGNQIDAYGAKVNFFNGSYYLYGSSFSTTGSQFGIKSYSSPDLEHWQYEGFLFNPNGSNPCSGSGACGRPHIVYSPKTAQYVLWANAGSPGYAVATSTSPSGPFTFLKQRASIDPKFDTLQPADFAVETFNGKGYIVFSALNFASPNVGSIWPPLFQTLHISELTSDFTNTTLTSYPVKSEAFDLIDQETESPDLFVTTDGTFYVSASNTCGYCNGTIGLMYRSNSINGTWDRQILSGYSCNGQVEGVLPLKAPGSDSVSYVWHSTSVPGGARTGFSGHIFQPLDIHSDGSVGDLDCSASASFDVDFVRGTDTLHQGAATEAIDGSPLFADYSAVCDTDQFTLFQTWQASKSGTVKSVSVNVARSVQTVPLTMTLFKFKSYVDLVAPEYKWTTLGTASYNASALTFVFDIATVTAASNATVSKGDLLGFSFSGMASPFESPNFVPYCYLEYKTASGASEVLYQQGGGQNSWRGPSGRTSPVYERVGKSMKFFVTYE